MAELQLSPEDVEFLVNQTGINDIHQLQSHILAVQSEAVAIHPHPCIRRFDFVRNYISTLPCYQTFIDLARGREGSTFLDVGCCCGTDIRKVIADGVPSRNVIGTDLRPGFWEIGHKLFLSSPDSFPVRFVAGNILDSSFLAPRDVVYDDNETATVVPDLELKNLSPLLGRGDFIHTASVFHLFSEAEQLVFAKRLASLLSPRAGSMIFGWHAGRTVKGFRTEARPSAPGMLGSSMFCHSPESWKEMWTREVFREGTVRVEVQLVQKERKVELVMKSDAAPQYLAWSVTRL